MLAPVVALLFGSCVLLGTAWAHPPKKVDVSDPAVVAVKEWLELALDNKYNDTMNEILHIEDAQKQVVNGYNYIMTYLVKTTYDNETVEWLLHKSKVYEHPPWDTTATETYLLSSDEVPVFEEATLDLPLEVTDYIETTLGSQLGGVVETADISEHFEQKGEIEYVTLTEGSSTEQVVAHRVSGEFHVGDKIKYVDISFMTKPGQFLFFDMVDLGIVDKGEGQGEEEEPLVVHDVKLLTVKTSMFGIFLVGLVTCSIFLVHLFRRRHKKSKEDWYIEQLTDIDEL